MGNTSCFVVVDFNFGRLAVYFFVWNPFIFASEPPVITTAPKNSTILVGSDVLLPCAADGEPMPRVSDTACNL